MTIDTNFPSQPAHMYLRKVDCSSFGMCPLQALALPRVFLWRLLTVLTRQTRQVVRAINQSIFNMISMLLSAINNVNIK
jgi:hypothetical protein